MRLSTKGVYALEATLLLSLKATGGKLLSIREIADETGLSDRYLEQIFTKLRKSGIVISSRGKQGGYCLALPPEKLTAGSVLRAAEGSLMPVNCLDDSQRQQPECSRTAICPTRPLWHKMEKDISHVVDSITLADLAAAYDQDGYRDMTDFVI